MVSADVEGGVDNSDFCRPRHTVLRKECNLLTNSFIIIFVKSTACIPMLAEATSIGASALCLPPDKLTRWQDAAQVRRRQVQEVGLTLFISIPCSLPMHAVWLCLFVGDGHDNVLSITADKKVNIFVKRLETPLGRVRYLWTCKSNSPWKLAHSQFFHDI